MSWTNFFNRIVVINLPHRTDRLLNVTKQMDEYNIPFEIVDGQKSELGGAEGLKLSVEAIFEHQIQNNLENVLIFEDDVLFLENPNPVMDKVVKQLPPNYHILYLGCQPTCGFHYRHSANLLQLDGAFSTHAWAVSLQGAKEILAAGFYAPIDNCVVATVQKQQLCYATNPILATQAEGYSDIGNMNISWRPFIEQKFNQKLAEI
jgi:GR25 family glycosyltransferase involved in LPS biosynthesis